MSDVFISYARSTAKQAQAATAALRALGYSVWIDDDLPAHRTYGPVIEEQMTAARAAVVIWSADATRSEWVLSEANRAREDRKLVQAITDRTRLPMPFDTIQHADLTGWAGDVEAPGWRKVLASIAELVGEAAVTTATATAAVAAPLTQPSRPSIAVLPFANLSGDPEQAYFADGMVVEIAGALSRFKWLFVIASGSSLSLKGKGLSPKEAADRLGVRYLLDGSVRRSAQNVRITAQLIDAVGETQIWSQRFDDKVADVFELQDKVALAVAGAIEPAVRELEASRAVGRPTGNMGAYDLYLRALYRQAALNRAGVLEAQDLLARSVALDPDYAPALAQAAFGHFLVFVSGWSDDPQSHVRSAIEAARRALQLATSDAGVLALAGFVISRFDADQAEAIALLDQAIALNPGSSIAWGCSGVARVGYGQDALAIEQLETALRLDPIGPDHSSWVGWIGMAQFRLGRFAEATPTIRAWVRQRDVPIGHAFLAASYGQLGQVAAARAALQRYRLTTNLPIAAIADAFPDQTMRRLFHQGIALAEGERSPDAGGDSIRA